MDLFQAVGSDVAILLFSAAGLAATTVAIIVDTKTQAAELAKEPVRFD
jgi:hypothetical protein